MNTTPHADVSVEPDECAIRSVDAAKVAAAKARGLPTGDVERITELFRLIGEPTRVRLLYALVEAGEMCVCDLAAAVEAPRNVGLARPTAPPHGRHRAHKALRTNDLLLTH